ncbi:MAG: hypothetical protein FD161_2533 [Limisphaerales bacterium]|nr:MAG: hypothetical protein FD161_2533 [Limisphaerales bacterium]KAG0508557.1 MAG: hypothetical protein E1N63_2284 [Limisphaerales bacterium]TXT50131.1 MAG: hypothetical protein FD140_2570 [Limisphaerales bacterium]
MRRCAAIGCLLLIVGTGAGCAPRATRRNADAAERRAVTFLVREVPAWSRENGCFSCHNNGDAARALYAARRSGFAIPESALADTTAWVSQPSRWEHNQGDPGFSDKRLANLQFAASLLAAVETGHSSDRMALRAAADKVAADQGEDGTWRIEEQDTLGSPATYGTTLATFSAWRVLTQSDSGAARLAAAKAAGWLRQAPMNNVPAAATLLRFAVRDDSGESMRRQAEALTFLRRAQTSDGGWGPYPNVPAEAFDTALVLLALAELPRDAEMEAMVRRGRAFLIAQQKADGSWPATTRPTGGESYAQRMSTTGWAVQALLANRGK